MDEEERAAIITKLTISMTDAVLEVAHKKQISLGDMMFVLSNVFWTIAFRYSRPENLQSNVDQAMELLEAGKEETLQKGAEFFFEMKAATGPIGNA